MKKALSLTLAALVATLQANAVTLISTSFDNLSSTNVLVDDVSRNVAAIPDWSVTDSSSLDLLSGYSFTEGTTGYASVPQGAWVSMLGDGSFEAVRANESTVNSALRAVNSNEGLIEFNGSAIGNAAEIAPINTGKFTFGFEVKPGNFVSDLSALFDFGTAATNGTWKVPAGGDANTDNGYFNVRIVGLDNATDFTFFDSPQLANTAPDFLDAPHIANAVNGGNEILGAGQYRLEIMGSDKSLNQRFAIDDFSLSGTVSTVIPEPSSYALGASLVALAGVTLMRRRRNSSRP